MKRTRQDIDYEEFVESKFNELKSVIHNEKNALTNKIKTKFSAVQNPIRLNISGKVFCVSKETLMSIENTYFYDLVANMDTVKPIDDGTFFIERNPLVFGRILDYLRTGKMDIRDLSAYALDMLNDDLDYYCIPLPAELQISNVVSPMYWDIYRKSKNVIFSDDKLTATKSSGNYRFNCGIIGNTAVDKYTVRIDERGLLGNIMIGFTTGAKWDCDGRNFKQNGWFLCAYNGRVYGIGIDDNDYDYDDDEFINNPKVKKNVDNHIINNVYNINNTNINNNHNNHNDDEDDRCYSTKMYEGDYITVIRQGTTIRFEKNKVDLGVCKYFTDIPDQPLFPAIDIRDINVSVSFVTDY